MPEREHMMSTMTSRPRAFLRALYFGKSELARRFRYALVGFDLFTIGLFVVISFFEGAWWIIPLDIGLGIILAIELIARIYASGYLARHLRNWLTIADILVIASLLLPAFIDNLGFLRILRALRVLRAYHLIHDLRQDSVWFRRNEDIVVRATNLFVFVFIITSVVYVTQHGHNPHIVTYIDALHFTVTTLSTTGYGDITLQGPYGRLLSIIMMLVGISLFLRLLQALFRPHKVRFECADCGLMLHDADAVHCKHCGRVMRIKDEGLV